MKLAITILMAMALSVAAVVPTSAQIAPSPVVGPSPSAGPWIVGGIGLGVLSVIARANVVGARENRELTSIEATQAFFLPFGWVFSLRASALYGVANLAQGNLEGVGVTDIPPAAPDFIWALFGFEMIAIVPRPESQGTYAETVPNAPSGWQFNPNDPPKVKSTNQRGRKAGIK